MRKRCADLLECLLGEAASRQTAEGLRARDLGLHDSASSVELRLQSRHGLAGDLGRDQAFPEVGPNRSIAVPAACHELCSCLRQPGVVEQGRAIQARERLLAGAAGVPRTGQPLVELGSRSSARGERPSRTCQCSCTAKLACKVPRSRPVQPRPDSEPRSHDRIRGQDSPRPTVELDSHAAALPLAQPGYGRSHASASADASASAATSALPFDAADSSAAIGSSRADAT